MIRRVAIALLIALTLSFASTYALSRSIRKSRRNAGAQIKLLAAAADLQAGDVVKPSDVKEIAWPAEVQLNGNVQRREDVVGRTLLHPVSANQPLLTRQLAAPGAGPGLPGRIPSGMRALSLKANQIVGVAGFLQPGARVDVLVTYHDAGSGESLTAMVLQDALILAAGQKTEPDPDGKPNTVDVVTLLVTPEAAERAVLSSTQGSVHFVLRNGSDHEQVSSAPVQVSALGLGKPELHDTRNEVRRTPPQTPKPLAHPAKAIPAQAPYHLAIIRGDKQTVETF